MPSIQGNTRGYVYAHESPSKHSSIDEEVMGGTAQAFLDLFTKRGWGTQVNLKGKLVEVFESATSRMVQRQQRSVGEPSEREHYSLYC